MTLRHFKIFIEVCETMNMTQAAERLYISQSAVSQAISDLEAFYGTKLFERLSKRIYLTDAGEKLLSYARHITKMTEEAEASIKSLSESGVIRIGASVTVGSAILPKLVKSFQNVSPSTSFEVIEDNTTVIESLILNNEVDLGLVEGEILSPDITIKPFLQDELILICGKEHPFSQKAMVLPSELEKENFIIREKGSGTRKLFEIKMAANNVSWSASWVCNNSETIKNAVENNLGISVISQKSVLKELENKTLFSSKIEGIEFIRQFKIAYHKKKYITQKMNQFMEHLINLY
ncbi:LysR family transcriptional regulator [Anaerotignum propionicum]|uniref:LysR family transcriptional regulator n=1 Tax=Anaerotignum propionicum TaxID=28446 RepID=UPI0021092E72|nr:LysR family transcriptional regulator [Anaerotignum propionicum]MCQ4935338.1 LysR family transcriptional regulator [Anaerotignum propionicum]